MNQRLTQSSTRLLAFGVLTIFLMSLASADVVFSDNFNDGNLDGWVVANNPSLPNAQGFWKIVGTWVEARPGSGSQLGTTNLSTTVDASGFKNLVLKFDRKLGQSPGDGFDASDEFQVLWSTNGNDFSNLFETGNNTYQEGVFASQSLTFPSSADGQSSITFRFVCSNDAASEFCQINDLSIEGDVIPNPALNLSSSTISSGSNGTTLTLGNNGNVVLSNIALTSSGALGVQLDPSLISSMPAGSSQNIGVLVTSSLASLNVGSNSATITALASDGTTTTGTVSLDRSFCDIGPVNDTLLELDVKITNNGKGTDSDWKLLDTIEVEVELENNGAVDLEDVVFEFGLFKKDSSRNVADDLIWLSEDDESFEFGDIDEDDDGNHIFEFRINPDEIDDGDYILVVKAFPDGDEEKTCVDYSAALADSDFGTSSRSFAEISIDKEGDKGKMVIVDTFAPSTINAQCGRDVSFSVDVYNVGDEDFEDQIKVNLFNEELGIDMEDVLLGDLDEGERARADFTISIPQNASNKWYTLSLTTEYDYDEDDGDYNELSDDTFRLPLNIEGCAASSSDVLISANLESGAVSGEEMTVKVLLTNTKNSARVFTLQPSGYQSWADVSETTSTLTVAALSAGEASIKFNIKKGVSGEQPFTILIYEGTNLVATQSVTVTIEQESRGFPGITGFSIDGENAYLWGLGLLNVLLLVIIIVVAIKLARK